MIFTIFFWGGGEGWSKGAQLFLSPASQLNWMGVFCFADCLYAAHVPPLTVAAPCGLVADGRGAAGAGLDQL